MKKIFALLLAMIMVFALAACGNDEPPSGSEGDKPGATQNGGENNNGGEENKGTGLWDVADADITILNEGHDVAIVPAGLKKGIGTGAKAQIYLRDPGSTYASIYKSLYEANYKEVVQADVDALVDYIEQEIGVEASKGGLSSYTEYIISTDAMEITILHYPSKNEVKVSAYIAGNDDSSDIPKSQWSNVQYKDYTENLAEPTFEYTIKGVIMDQLTINAEATEAEIAAWKQSLLDAGFEEYREGEQWAVKNATHNIQMNGFVNGIAYIYIGLEG